MNRTEKFLHSYLDRLFPSYASPNSSRFSQLFAEMCKKTQLKLKIKKELMKSQKDEEEKIDEEVNLEKYIIYPQKILSGEEKRTSIIIKGIPCAFGCQNFYELLRMFCKDINFFYIPGFAIVKWQYIYAFATIGNRRGVLNIYEGLSSIKEKYKNFKGYDFSQIEIYFSKSQNINALTKKFKKDGFQNNFVVCK